MADAAKKTAASTTRRSAPETMKLAFTIDGDRVDVAVFGTDKDRSDFQRARPTEWWRLADVAKGEVTSIEVARKDRP